MRAFAATLVIGAALVGVLSPSVRGFPAGFAVGVAYMMVVAIVLNSRTRKG